MRVLCVTSTVWIFVAVAVLESNGHEGEHHGHHDGEHEHHEIHEHHEHHQINENHENEEHHHHRHNHTEHHNGTAWVCPSGWVSYNDGGNITCLYLSDQPTESFNLKEACAGLQAQPVLILTETKSDFLLEQARTNEEEYWLPLHKDLGYGQPFKWNTHDDSIDAQYHYMPDEIRVDDYMNFCVKLSGPQQQWEVTYCESSYKYICERDPVCLPGLFGPACTQECHCLGEPCDTNLGHATCKWGCERGWSGPSCSQQREAPEVRYFCINSPEEHVGSYVDIHINTKGVNYRSIYPTLTNSSVPGAWCDGTTLSSPDPGFQHLTIAIPVNDSVREDIRHGRCAGQEVSSNQFAWTVTIQEYPGIVLDTDLQVVISCDFNTSETMQRSAQLGESSHDHSPAHKEELSPDSVDVTLQVVDPYTKRVITEAHVGSPAQLQIKFGYHHGSLVDGVCPHHCVASTSDGAVVKNLLDGKGCTNMNSPVSEFSSDANTTNTISTHWFPLFAFDGHDNVQFKCSFELCFDSVRHCEPGCRRGHHQHHHRRRRDASSEGEGEKDTDWSTGVVRILPSISPQVQRDYWLSRRQHLLRDINQQQQQQQQQRQQHHQQQQQQQQQQRQHHEKQKDTEATATPPSSPRQDQVEVTLSSFLNPVTCVVFLVLLVIFLALFLALHHTLTKGITGLRQDLVDRQSRDRVIHCSPDQRLGKDAIRAI